MPRMAIRILYDFNFDVMMFFISCYHFILLIYWFTALRCRLLIAAGSTAVLGHYQKHDRMDVVDEHFRACHLGWVRSFPPSRCEGMIQVVIQVTVAPGGVDKRQTALESYLACQRIMHGSIHYIDSECPVVGRWCINSYGPETRMGSLGSSRNVCHLDLTCSLFLS